MAHPNVTRVSLDADHSVWTGVLPDNLRLTPSSFDALWELHPTKFHTIKIHGRDVQTPRWEQAFGVDYAYTGNVNRALPIPDNLLPLLDYARTNFEGRLNGLLINWYDATLGHYIGPHRDAHKELIEDAPIITISFGAERTFRLKRWKGSTKIDLRWVDGSLVILPYATNSAWTHEVPLFARDHGRRVSVTLRAFIP